MRGARANWLYPQQTEGFPPSQPPTPGMPHQLPIVAQSPFPPDMFAVNSNRGGGDVQQRADLLVPSPATTRRSTSCSRVLRIFWKASGCASHSRFTGSKTGLKSVPPFATTRIALSSDSGDSVFSIY